MAARAAVVAEMADVRGRVVVGRPARAAVLRVGGMGEALAGDGGVVDPEPERLGTAARDVGQEWVVGVHDRPRRGIEVGDSRAPALGDVLELAVAVELVAEKVPETDGLRPDAAGDVGKRALVDLEEPEVGPVARREAPMPPPRRDSLPRGCARASRDLRRSPRPSRRSSSSRWSPRRAPIPAEGGAASLPTAPGSTVARIFPGIVVPPPLPASRESRPAARESAISTRSRTGASLWASFAHSNEGTLRPSLERGGCKARCRRSWGLNSNAARATSAEEGEDHMRQVSGTRGNLRGSALWGKPKGESRSSALWGKPGRGFAILALVAALAAPVAATAGQTARSVQAARALVPASLMADAEAHPDQGLLRHRAGQPWDEERHGRRRRSRAPRSRKPGKAKGLRKSFTSVNGVSAELTGAQIVDLAKRPGILAITPDSRIRLSGQFTNDQTWVDSAGVSDFFVGNTLVAAERPGDRDRRQRRRGRSHGLRRPGRQAGHNDEPASERDSATAAGTARSWRASPRAPGPGTPARRRRPDRLDRRHGRQRHGDDERRHRCGRLDPREQGHATTSASRTSRCSRRSPPASCTTRSTRRSRSSGSTASSSSRQPATTATTGSPPTVAYAPGNDPFVITVGASDTNDTGWTRTDDTAAPWSAYGYTLDGFAKPDLGAPGRSLVGPVPSLSTMPLGASRARDVLRLHVDVRNVVLGSDRLGRSGPDPGQEPELDPGQGQGRADADRAADRRRAWRSASARSTQRRLRRQNPPNPNLGLNQFVGADGTGGVAFDSASWANAATANASWNQASWNRPRGPGMLGNASWNAASWARLPGTRRAGRRPPGTLPAGQPLPGPRRAGTRRAGQPLPGQRRDGQTHRTRLIPRTSEIRSLSHKRGRLRSFSTPSLRLGVQPSLGPAAFR